MRQLIARVLMNRFVRFVSIGVVCLVAFQLPVMLLLTEAGTNPLLANIVGFVLSGVANFEIQRRFTFDNKVNGTWVMGLLKFQLTSVGALTINTIVTGLVFYKVGMYFPPLVAFMQQASFGLFDAWAAAAVVIGAFAGTGANFLMSRYFTYGHTTATVEIDDMHGVETSKSGAALAAPAEQEQVPNIHALRAHLSGETLAVFMPAYREAENLPTTVGKLVAYLRSLRLFEFRVIVVNDGSPDNTGAVADALARKYPEVQVIHHEVNKGYGGALITGFNAVVESGMRYWGFCDSDGQFDPHSFGTLLMALVEEDADLSVGYRLDRRSADSQWRYWLGRAWHFFGRFAVGTNAEGQPLLSVRDVDCGIKVGVTKSLARIVERLQGQAAAISPELIARTNLELQAIVERGVTHLSRLAGTSTGDNPKVMIRSAWNVLKLGLRFRVLRYFSWVNDPLSDVQESLSKEGWKQ